MALHLTLYRNGVPQTQTIISDSLLGLADELERIDLIDPVDDYEVTTADGQKIGYEHEREIERRSGYFRRYGR